MHGLMHAECDSALALMVQVSFDKQKLLDFCQFGWLLSGSYACFPDFKEK